MLILHAAFYEGSLRLWGELAPGDEAPTPIRRTANGYPYRAEIAELKAGLAQAGLTLQADKQTVDESVIWLPTQGEAPLPSSPLIADVPKSRKAIALAPWQLPALALTPADAIDLLAAVREHPALTPGVAASDELHYWGKALRLAGALVYRQQVLPDLVEQRRGAYRACWTPVFLGEDSAHWERLACAMPPAARAIGSDRRAPPDAAPRDVLRAFLAW
ncbi:MAG: hypothetical protein LM522_02435, partial [Candidatus Contendobacter sp.]|nr:hypothetical protein [Candidatus Contendobacter sp.]